MLTMTVLGVAAIVVLAVRWKRWRLPLLLLLLALVVLQLMRCRGDAPGSRDVPPVAPHNGVCPHPDTGCTEPGAVPGGGSGPQQRAPIKPRGPDPVCPHPDTGCTEPGAGPDAATQ